jgi:hypothetical protein
VSLRSSVIFGESVDLISFIDSTIAFTTAFCLETLVFSHQAWAKLSVGIAFAVMVLSGVLVFSGSQWNPRLVPTFQAIVHLLKDRLVGFTRGLRGGNPEPGLDAGDSEDDDSRSKCGASADRGP